MQPFPKINSTKKDCSDRKWLTKVTVGSKIFIAEKTTRLQEVNQNFTYTWQPGVKWYVLFFSSFPWVYSFGQLSFYDDIQARDSNVSLTKLQHQAGETHTIILNIAIAHFFASRFGGNFAKIPTTKICSLGMTLSFQGSSNLVDNDRKHVVTETARSLFWYAY